MESFSEISHAIFRDYIRSAVIIDDEWPEHEILISDDEVDESDSIAGGEEDDQFDAVEAALTSEAIVPPEAPSAEDLDARILGRLRHALLRQGVLTCGLRYQRKDRKTAIELARRADIVVLDWHLIRDDGSEALEILKELQGDALRFVCIWTGHGRAEEVKKMLIRSLGSPLTANGKADLQFPNLVIAIRIKEDMEDDPELAVSPDRLLEVAIGGLANSFGGLVQLAVLEMIQRHREHLPRILEHIGRPIDTAVLLEAGDEASPVGPGGAFLGVLVDEWRSRLERDHTQLKSLSSAGRRAFGSKLWGTRSEDWPDRMKGYLVGFGAKPKIAEECTKAVLSGLDRWLEEGCERGFPKVSGVSSKIAAWAALYSVTNGIEPLDPLLRLESLFDQQFNPATALTQGTVVRIQDGETEHHLICTTPLCDAERPSKIGNLFTFVRTRVVPTEEVLQGGDARNYCVVEHNDKYLCLAVLFKEQVSLEVGEPRFESEIVHARLSLGGRREQDLLPGDGGNYQLRHVAQLRLDHALALTSTAASDASRIGVNKVELIRDRISRGRPKKKA